MSLLANSAVIGGETNTGDIGHSLRFRSAASAGISWTPASAGSRTSWAWHGFVKRGTQGTVQQIFGAIHDTNNQAGINFQADNTLRVYSYIGAAYQVQLISTAVFRDTEVISLLVVFDTPNATASERVRIYVNGSRLTTFSTATYPAQSYQGQVGNTVAHSIGKISTTNYFDGYLSRIAFVDGGGSLTPQDFVTFDSQINEWVSKTQSEVKAVVDAGGANSFMLDFDNGTSLTTLGYDKSSKGNNWTLNNFSLTAGATYDWMLHVPGNSYATLNPLSLVNTAYAATQDANLRSNCGTGAVSAVLSTIPIAGKSWSVARMIAVGNGCTVGIALANGTSALIASNSITYQFDGQKRVYGTSSAFGASYTVNDVIAIEVDKAAGTIQFFKQTGGSGSFVSQGTITDSRITSDQHFFVHHNNSSSGSSFVSWNFGQQPEATYVPTAGFLALCQANLSDSGTVIVSGSFTGNVSADGPCVWMNGTPKTLTINGNAVTFGTHADRLATGFKIRTASTSYNSTGTNTWAATIDSNLKNIFKYNNGEAN